MYNVTQCTLQKQNTSQTAWIPSKFAQKGKFVKIKDDNGWEVTSTGATRSYSEMNKRSQDYKKTRSASDI